MIKSIKLSRATQCITYVVVLLVALLWWNIAWAVYDPADDIYIFGSGNAWTNGNIAFSYSPTLSWSAPISPTKVSTGYIFHGNVWLDSVWWTTFDHGIANSEVKIHDPTCIDDVARPSCTLTGFLWSKNAGWIRFSWNNGALDVEFHRPTLTLSWLAWSNQVGWIEISNIKLILGPIYPSLTWATDLWGGDYAMTTTWSMDLPLAIPSSIFSLLSWLPPITMDLCISWGTYCKIYTFDSINGYFPDLDVSLAADYDYTITDPFWSKTSWVFHVFAWPIISNGSSPISWTYLGIGLLKKYCADNPSDANRCPDTTPSTSYVIWELKNWEIVGTRYANNQDAYIANLRLRDAYGNPVTSVIGIKNVETTLQLTSTLDFITTPHLYQYGWMSALLWLGEAFSLDYYWDAITLLAGFPYTFTRPYVPSGESIKIRSYAPTTVGNTTVPSNNNINISDLSVRVTQLAPYSGVGEWTYNVSTLLKTSPLPYNALVNVTSIDGFSNVQMWRSSYFTGAIVVNDSQNAIDVWSSYVIHALTIGDGISTTTSTFQDFFAPSGEECHAFTDINGASVPWYVSYCERWTNGIASPASVIALPFATSRDHVFSAFPRRIVEIDLEQGYLYDSIIRYTLGGKEIVYPSITAQTAWWTDKVFGNAVKIIGQKSGNNIFQSFVNSEQTSISSQSRSEAINTIRKNVWLLTRNVSFAGDTFTGSNIKVYKKDILLNPTQELITDGKRTIVAYGDITVNANLINSNDAITLAIIALKDESGNGWNIFIASNVKRIDATLVAQGTIFSGEKTWTTRYYAQEAGAVDTLKNQLYIYWAVSSLNTIWGASLESGSRCPIADIACDNSNALIYDFEHMRYFRWGPSEAASLARASANLEGDAKNSSLIIEFNPELLRDPPPGIRNEN